MKKIIALLLTITILLTPLSSMAINIPGYEGGIQNENTYKEVIFVTGKPIVMEGSLTIKTKGKSKSNTVTETYTYKLENIKEDAKLSRTIKMTVTLEPTGNQIASTRTLDSYKETINIGKKRYEAKDEFYQWNQGTITHQTPLLSYYAGDFVATKTYKVDKGTENVTVETTGELVGYDSPWSATETQTIDYVINFSDKLKPDKTWQGTATVEASYNKTKDYSYAENIPWQISFKGGYRVVEQHDNVLKYNYDLPKVTEGNNTSKARNYGKDSFSIDTNPIITRLNIPAVRDVLGHQYEEELLLLASMDALPLNSTYLGPDSSMSRGDFAKAIVKSMDIPIEKQEETKKKSRKKQEPTPPLFKDVKRNHRNFDYIEEVGKRGIMVGVDKDNFRPDEPLTRAEAYAIIIRLLGFQNLAPINKNYNTGYKDDKAIPAWAKDHIYVAKELGMTAKGDYFYPNREITKGESAKLLADFIHYLQIDLKNDYRENVLNN